MRGRARVGRGASSGSPPHFVPPFMHDFSLVGFIYSSFIVPSSPFPFPPYSPSPLSSFSFHRPPSEHRQRSSRPPSPTKSSPTRRVPRRRPASTDLPRNSADARLNAPSSVYPFARETSPHALQLKSLRHPCLPSPSPSLVFLPRLTYRTSIHDSCRLLIGFPLLALLVSRFSVNVVMSFPIPDNVHLSFTLTVLAYLLPPFPPLLFALSHLSVSLAPYNVCY